ncbi:hypothetical protein EGX06_06100 [Enterococcus hirae]|nr:hypothetical protein CKY13_09755 [Enterococcus hirae]ROZ14915.1 hypothetical protein EGX06_06100 [Enterococcus hirae]
MFQHIFCNYLNGVYLEDVYLKHATDYRTKTTFLIYHIGYKIATIFPSFFLFIWCFLTKTRKRGISLYSVLTNMESFPYNSDFL